MVRRPAGRFMCRAAYTHTYVDTHTHRSWAASWAYDPDRPDERRRQPPTTPYAITYSICVNEPSYYNRTVLPLQSNLREDP